MASDAFEGCRPSKETCRNMKRLYGGFNAVRVRQIRRKVWVSFLRLFVVCLPVLALG